MRGVSSHETLGLLLVRDGIITRPQLYDALRLQRQNNRLLGTCLLALGYVQPQTLLDFLSRQLSIPALPPGTLSRAAREAVARVPGEVAVRLRIVPYCWDGEILGVAFADGRALNQLHEVAYHSQSTVGAYVALEMEIEAVLRALYPEAAQVPVPVVAEASAAAERARPARIAPLVEVPTRDFGAALGIEEGATAAAGGKTPIGTIFRSAPPRAPTRGPPPPAGGAASARRAAAAKLALDRTAFYDAVEQLYLATSSVEVGKCVGRALLNYFGRVLILEPVDKRLAVIGFAGVAPPAESALLSALPTTAAAMGLCRITYGAASADPRGDEITRAFGIPPAPTALVAAATDADVTRFLAYADNGDAADLYDDLHDVEMLLKEAETALRILGAGGA
ncbi:MAG: hypothetical protein HY903_15545 [Deltaproteobacteria bacterium]|nr:hypothetical protein [Deltaproteobacteria bacterium]